MTKSIKAALLSAFVFPGVGHLFLKKLISGSLLVCAAFLSAYVVISKSVERALLITEQILSGEIMPDATAITDLISKQPAGDDALLLNVAWGVLFITWLIGIVGSYIAGRANSTSDVKDAS